MYDELEALSEESQEAADAPRLAPANSGLSVVGLFAGIGGLEAGFARAGHHSTLLCERDPAASRVLAAQFPDARLHHDVTTLGELPVCDIVTAGFPCQDLSSVGQRRGIGGPNSGLIDYVFTLLASQARSPRWLVLENVPFMLQLDRGRAMARIVDELELNGWSWAYRTIDTRSFGLPHRRRRVILLASKDMDPRGPLLCPDCQTARNRDPL